jgi:hypothetical protein
MFERHCAHASLSMLRNVFPPGFVSLRAVVLVKRAVLHLATSAERFYNQIGTAEAEAFITGVGQSSMN